MKSGSDVLRVAVALLVAILLVAALGGCGNAAETARPFRCPMHPTMVAERPGDCSICGMRLVEDTAGAAPGKQESSAGTSACVCPFHHDITSDQPEHCPKCGMRMVPNAECDASCGGAKSSTARPESAASSASAGEREPLFYRNPMDATITSPVPARDAMGMNYVPVYASERPAAVEVPGLAAVELDPRAIRLAGIATVAARRTPLGRSLRTAGVVTPDEGRIRHVHSKIAGFVEKLHVNFTGQLVRKGEPILDIYSPELLASQEELLRVRDAAAGLERSSLPEVRQGGAAMLAAARRRLELYDVPASFIAEVERRGSPSRVVTQFAPSGGFVSGRMVFEGHRVEPGQELFTVTDIARVWISAAVYESEALLVHLGQQARLTLSSAPGQELRGRVSYIDPFLSPATRTLALRFEFDNPGLSLKPAMFADVELEVEGGEGIAVPEEAVMNAGPRRIVFVERGPGRFEPREVRTGIRGQGQVQILEGVLEGERVVVHANFLLDSESRLRAAIAASAPAARATPALRPEAGKAGRP